jgi:ferredoxin
VELRVDGNAVSVPEGATILEACDQAGRYVPRLCSYPGLGCGDCAVEFSGPAARSDEDVSSRCGLCVVQIGGEGEEREVGDTGRVLACCTQALADMEVVTDTPDLQSERLERLAEILAVHPHICLSCPDRDGCTRDECTFGIPIQARCCERFGHCELGRLVAYVDVDERIPRRALNVGREAITENRIRREPGLCLGCGRCVNVCHMSARAGRSLHLVTSDGRLRAEPKRGTLKASGCTFCGQCVLVCPTGALTAPGGQGARWLERCRQRSDLRAPVLPPDAWRPVEEAELEDVPRLPGVFLLADEAGRVLRIGGAADLSLGVSQALDEPACATARRFRFEPAALFTQRESELLARFAQEEGHLPPGNDLGDDLFSDDLLGDDLFSDEL